MSEFHPILPERSEVLPPLVEAARFALRNPVKTAVIFTAAALVGCDEKPAATCPSIEKLVRSDPAADARAALAKGDRHLLTLGGFVGTTPGVEDVGTNATNSVEIEGTSDTATEACRRLGNVAETYATKYNQTIVNSAKP